MARDRGPLLQPKKKHERDAELAYWYGVDVSDWSEAKKLGYIANLNRVKSQQILFDGNYDRTDYKGAYALAMAAHGDPVLANEAQAQAMEALIDAKCQKK